MLMLILFGPHKSPSTRYLQECYTCYLSGLDPGHMPMNFKIALPTSYSFTAILKIVDYFSK